MKKKIVPGILTLLLMSTLALAFNIQPVRAESKTIVVPDDYQTIQEAINTANPGDTIYVRAGVYYENIVVNKSVFLIGEDKETAIINITDYREDAIIITSNNVVVKGFTILHSVEHEEYGVHGWGILLNASDCIIMNNILRNNSEGIVCWSGSRNNLTNNVLIGNEDCGIVIFAREAIAYNNIIQQNNITSNYCGVALMNDYYNVVKENIVHSNEIGIFALGSLNSSIQRNIIRKNGWKHKYSGIWFCFSNYSMLFDNEITENYVGMCLGYANNSIVFQNNITNNFYGVFLNRAYGNKLYNNNFVENNKQVYDHSWDCPDRCLPSINIWNNGYPSGGNHWSDYKERYPGVEDVYSGPYQNETGSDGIWDHPYVIDENNQDCYPLVNPWTPTPLLLTQLKVGDIVETTDHLKVRDITDWNDPLDPENVLFIMSPPYKQRTSPPNNVGKIINGPKMAGGYIWWKIEWDNGEVGWSAEGPTNTPDVKYLIKSDKSLVKFEDIEDPFNYQGQYTLNADFLTSKENKALKYVMAYAKIRKISPALIMAIISWESNFDANAKGDYRILYKGESKPTAFGYMQVRWPAAFDAGFRGKERKIDGELEEHYKWFNENCEKIWSVKPTLEKFFAYLDWPEKGLDLKTNIRYGTGYILLLYTKIKKGVYTDVYEDVLKSTISAYNRGHPWLPNRVTYVLKVLESVASRAYRGYRHYLSIRNEKQRLATIESRSPVDLIVSDPDNLTITREISEIPGVLYYLELDIDENGELDDMIVILKRKIGDYLIDVIPEPDAAPTDMYTLEMWLGNITIVLAENVEVNNIPLQPYIARSLEAEIIPIIPANIDFDPDTLNLESNGTWVTVYIELPIEHGYNVSMINLESVWLNSQVQAEVKPTEIGDYDDDGIPDLMIKFNRTDVQNILEVGEKVKITIFGKLIDERLFEGKDMIQVIATPQIKHSY